MRRTLALLLAWLPALALAQNWDPAPDWITLGTGDGPAAVEALAGVPDRLGVYAAGGFQGDIAFQNLSTTAPAGRTAGFLVALDGNGAPRWIRGATSASGDVVFTGVVTSGDRMSHDVLVSGYASGPAGFGPAVGGSGSVWVAPGSQSGFVARYSSDGDLRWVVGTGGAGRVWPHALAAANGGALLVGAFAGTVSWDQAGAVTRTAAGGTDAFAAWYRPNGTLERVEAFGGPSVDSFADVAFQEYPPRTWAVGTFRDEMLVAGDTLRSLGGSDAFAVAFSEDGEPVRAFGFGGPADETGDGIFFDEDWTGWDTGTVVLAGSFRDSLATTVGTVHSGGEADLYLAHVNAADGIVRFLQPFGGLGDDVLHKLAEIGALDGDYAYETFSVAATVGDGISFLGSQGETLPGRGRSDALAFTVGAWGTLPAFAATLAGGAGEDDARAITGVECLWIGSEVKPCRRLAFGGSVVGPVTFGAAQAVAGADADAFVAYYPESALNPFGVSREDGPSSASRIEVGPNPVRGEAWVSLTLNEPADAHLRVIDVLGREVAVLHEGPLAAGAARWRVPDALPSGLYVVRLVGPGTLSRTFTVVR